MHAHTDQLLSLRDGEPVDARVVRHVAGCPSCQRDLECLKQMQGELRSLPPRQVPAAAWRKVQATLRQPSAPSFNAWSRVVPIVEAAGFAAIAVMVALRFIAADEHAAPRVRVHEPPAPVAIESVLATPALSAATVEQLVEQSRQLEGVLRNLPAPPRVERVTLAATTDIIEQRIQWLDLQLSFEPEAQLSQEEARRLWHERVDLMDSLVKVRYAQAQGLAF